MCFGTFRRDADFAARVRFRLRQEQRGKFGTFPVAEPRPNEVKKFVDKYESKKPAISK